MSCGGDRRLRSDPVLVWLWCRPAAIAAIRPLGWEPLYATGVALKSKKKRSELDRRYYISYIGWKKMTWDWKLQQQQLCSMGGSRICFIYQSGKEHTCTRRQSDVE